jgi:phosphatidylglycerol:prolipoprotein diacylglycerol transferase
MININIDPILFRWGPVALGWHGLWLAAGVVIGSGVFVHEGRRKGVDFGHLDELILWTVILGYVGARLLHVLLYDWETYAAQPVRILAVHEGGLAVYGALIGGTIAMAGYARWRGLSFWHLVDAAALGIPAGVIVGRVGCTIAGDVCGVPTHGAWGLVYWHPRALVPPYLRGVATFPAPSVLQTWNACLLMLLLVLQRREHLPGVLFLTYMIIYSVGRFVVSFWQVEEPLVVGLKATQVVALAIAGLAILFSLYLRVRASQTVHASAGR